MREGDANFGLPAELIGHDTRSSMLLALLDGRALPMSMLASEAGVSASTASEHLAKLTEGGIVRVRPQGRHRYYELASPAVAEAIEALARLAPPRPVRSLRSGTRAHALRRARTCYDHLAGHLGVAVMRSLLDRGALTGGDGIHHPESESADRLAAPGQAVEYSLTPGGRELMVELGVRVPSGRRRLVGYCVDWTEQRHHLGGALGAALLRRLEEREWVLRERPRGSRAVSITEAGRIGFLDVFDIDTELLVQAVAS